MVKVFATQLLNQYYREEGEAHEKRETINYLLVTNPWKFCEAAEELFTRKTNTLVDSFLEHHDIQDAGVKSILLEMVSEGITYRELNGGKKAMLAQSEAADKLGLKASARVLETIVSLEVRRNEIEERLANKGFKDISVQDLQRVAQSIADGETKSSDLDKKMRGAIQLAGLKKILTTGKITAFSHIEKEARKLHIKINAVKRALNYNIEDEESPVIEVERVGLDHHNGGLVDLVMIPITSNSGVLDSRTPFKNQSGRAIMLFRRRPVWGETRFENHTTSITWYDLLYASQEYPASLEQYEDLFIQSRDGSGLTEIKEKISKRESDKALRRLRSTTEFTFKQWIEMYCLDNKLEYDSKKDVISYARELGLINASDKAQGKAFMEAGNAATHSDEMVYTGIINPIVHLDWLEEILCKRYFGIHWLQKTLDDGSPYVKDFAIEEDEDLHRVRRSVFDQLHNICIQEEVHTPQISDLVSLLTSDQEISLLTQLDKETKNREKEGYKEREDKYMATLKEESIGLSDDEIAVYSSLFYPQAENQQNEDPDKLFKMMIRGIPKGTVMLASLRIMNHMEERIKTSLVKKIATEREIKEKMVTEDMVNKAYKEGFNKNEFSTLNVFNCWAKRFNVVTKFLEENKGKDTAETRAEYRALYSEFSAKAARRAALLAYHFFKDSKELTDVRAEEDEGSVYDRFDPNLQLLCRKKGVRPPRCNQFKLGKNLHPHLGIDLKLLNLIVDRHFPEYKTAKRH